MEVKELISKGKFQLYRNTAFFSYLVENLEIKEDNSISTMAVDGKGTMYFNPDFVTKICPDNNTNVLEGVLVHEAMHLVLEHPKRMKGRTIMLTDGYSLWNVATDIYINNALDQNNFSLPEGGLLPKDNRIELNNGSIVIEDIDKKTSEDIYKEIARQLPKSDSKGGQGQSSGGQGQSGEQDWGKNFDEHVDWDKAEEGKDGKSGQSQEKDWKEIKAKATAVSKMRGQNPAGLSREFDFLDEAPQINWKHYVKNYINSQLPSDYTWSRPNKNYIAGGTYLPAIKRESVNVLFSIDVSGSISKEDLNAYMREIYGMSRQFSGANFRVLFHDVEITNDFKVKGNFLSTVKKWDIKGGGGTSHIPLYNYVKEKKLHKEHTILISFTDGYSKFPDKPSIPTLFILKDGISKKQIPFGKAIELN